MFRIFTFRQLSIISFIICLIMLLLSVTNIVTPSIGAFSQSSKTVPIIMYHHITSSQRGNDYILPLKILESDFEYMKKNGYTPVSLNALFQYVKGGKPLPEKPVVITFDDGQKSFITKVLPLLEKYSYPANVNIIGSLVELYTKNHDNNDSYAYLNSDDIKALSSHPLVEIGCHSYNLHSLSGRKGMGKIKGESETEYTQIIKEDIDTFQKLFVSLTGEKAICIAYPYGIKNNTLSSIVKNEGFSIILTCRESTNNLTIGGDLCDLGRFNRPYGKNSKTFFESFS
ncbi:MAG: polysaccharide deacetylase family protein [Clostridia bacterium]|nr:polysaccharide deacetylase family protein [Clostridia bacterium]